jgi:hypothetical protein
MVVNILEVKTDSAHDEFVGREFGIDDVGIVDDVTAEKEAPSDGEEEIHGFAKRNENADEPGHTQSNQSAEKERTHSRKVILMKG